MGHLEQELGRLSTLCADPLHKDQKIQQEIHLKGWDVKASIADGVPSCCCMMDVFIELKELGGSMWRESRSRNLSHMYAHLMIHDPIGDMMVYGEAQDQWSQLGVEAS